MTPKRGWREELKIVVDMMRDLSRVDDPQAAALLYAQRLTASKLLPIDERLSISRRGLKSPYYRITRSSRWTDDIDPWKHPERLPMYSSGLLGELIYCDDPVIIDDLPARLKADDPAFEDLRGFELLATSPQFEDGESLNMNVVLVKDKTTFPLESVPTMVWMSNLWGRGVLNLRLRQELQKSHEKLTAANAELDRELRVVGELQRSLLPLSLPDIPGLELAAHYKTSERAGGDYYDIFDCGDGCWGILIADVSGHGAPAAVIMAITHAIAHLHPGKGTPPGELLTFVNKSLASRYTNGNGSFVTAFYGIYESSRQNLIYARAGHNPPRLLRDGIVHSLDGHGGVPLGLARDSTYGECTQSLKAGDSLLLYTDGIVEARSAAGEMFGVERVDEALARGGAGAREAMDRVLGALDTFTGGAPPLDDQTLLSVAMR
jgi:sigma-B regulation protein RsbU (phosphoserine phosphatase)